MTFFKNKVLPNDKENCIELDDFDLQYFSEKISYKKTLRCGVVEECG